MRALIIGCGYLGSAVGNELHRNGALVLGLRRTLSPDASASCSFPLATADVTRGDSLPDLRNFDSVLFAVSSSRGGIDVYEQVYLEGLRNALFKMRAHPPKVFAYTSSTSVYGQVDGSIVTEQSETSPQTATGRILVEAEKIAQSAPIPSVIFRVAGIYGPGRGHLFHQFVRGEARIHGEGSRILNMIHRDDAARAIAWAMQNPPPSKVYNLVDDEPVAEKVFFAWLAERLKRPLPPNATPEETAARKRGFTNKRVSNARLRKDRAQVLEFPTFREGYAGELNKTEQTL